MHKSNAVSIPVILPIYYLFIFFVFVVFKALLTKLNFRSMLINYKFSSFIQECLFPIGSWRIQHLVVDDQKWSRMTHAQKIATLDAYKNTGVDGKRTHLDVPDVVTTDTSEITISDKHLPTTALESGITTIPMPILERRFDKANRLLELPENIIPKPGATDGSYIVPGHSNTIHIVTPGKGVSLKCDRSCVNVPTRICEHILAVAQTQGSLNEFFAWYKRSKRGPRLLDMALGSTPKSAGRKPSNRKRSNRQKIPSHRSKRSSSRGWIWVSQCSRRKNSSEYHTKPNNFE